MDKTLPAEYRQYQWVADMFSKIKGVNLITLMKDGTELNMIVSNELRGKAMRKYNLPLRTLSYVDYQFSPDCPHDYDIMKMEDPEALARLAVAKAKLIFNDTRPN